MASVGLPVPPGFVLTIEAYRRFYETNDLAPRVAAELARLDTGDPAALARSAGALQQLIVDGDFPDTLRESVGAAYATLSEGLKTPPRVAVRSSATAEDTAEFSFAGMFESFLNVSGIDGLVENIKACWASTSTGSNPRWQGNECWRRFRVGPTSTARKSRLKLPGPVRVRR